MVTFLLTDVEGSTRLWEARPGDMATALAGHDALLADVVQRHGGELVKTKGEGDSTFSVFDDPAAAVAAALDGQRELANAMFRVRMAIHTGHAELRDADYFGPTVNRCARLRGAAHGGQVVLSLVTRQLARDRLPDGASLLDLGMHHLRDLTEPERVYQLCHPDIEAEFPPLATLDRRRDNLPVALTRFVGRSVELADLDDALRSSRLVTLIGPGGTGKTRLAIEAASHRVDDHADGVWLVELASVTDPGLAIGALAGALGVREEAGEPLSDSVARHLASRDALLVMDNCEHLVASAAALAELALRAGPAVRVLATSRQALGLTGEQVWPVPPLSYPELAPFVDSEAVALFVDRARSVDPRLTIGAAEQEAISQICRQLDGLPLAIELAAALVDRMSVRVIAERLPERFELLNSGSRAAPLRQRSLAAAIDWSYELLDEPAQRAFARLSAFPDGFDIDGAEAVAGEGALAAVGQLVGGSLLLHAGGRYSMLETMRGYAAERLAASGEAGAVHDRLVEWAKGIIGSGDFDAFAVEHANLTTALRWSISRTPRDALVLANGLGPYWDVRGHWSEGRRLLDEVLSRAGDTDAAMRALALRTAGGLAFNQGDLSDAETLLVQSLALAEEADDDTIVYRALTELGGLAHMRGNVGDARVHFEAALAIGQTQEDPRSIAGALGNLGILAHATGDLAAAIDHYSQGLVLARQVGDPSFLAPILSNAGMAYRARGDLAAAVAAFSEALEVARTDANPADMATALTHLSEVSRINGDPALARANSMKRSTSFTASATGPTSPTSSTSLVRSRAASGSRMMRGSCSTRASLSGARWAMRWAKPR